MRISDNNGKLKPWAASLVLVGIALFGGVRKKPTEATLGPSPLWSPLQWLVHFLATRR